MQVPGQSGLKLALVKALTMPAALMQLLLRSSLQLLIRSYASDLANNKNIDPLTWTSCGEPFGLGCNDSCTGAKSRLRLVQSERPFVSGGLHAIQRPE